MNDSGAEWLTVAQAAAQLGISERTVRRRCESGKLTAERKPGEGGGLEWHIAPESIAASDRAATRTGGRTDRRPSNRTGADSERSDGQTVSSGHATAWPSERTDASGQTDTDLARIQGYMARDMELVIARAVNDAVMDATAPLLDELRALRRERAADRELIEKLTQAVERLSESRTDPPQAAPEPQTTATSSEPLREAQRQAQVTEKQPLSRAPLWLRFFGIRWKW